MPINPLLYSDGYKQEHHRQYPDGTTLIYSNMTARSSKHAKMSKEWDGKTIFFGLQGFIKSFLIDAFNDGFFKRDREEAIAEYRKEIDAYLGPQYGLPAEKLRDLHNLGYLPLSIRALPEGSRVPIKVPFLTIENTHPDFYWLTNFVETVMSCDLWHPITCATIAADYRALMNRYAEKTGTPADFVKFQGHDFSFRGLSCRHSAHTTGAAHLTSFVGTDTIPAIPYLRKYYEAGQKSEMIGVSVAATEHSCVCAGGIESEIETIRRLITQVYPSDIVSYVADSWDLWKVVTDYAETLKPEIMARNGKLTFRPDSGVPADILCGIKYTTYNDIETAKGYEWDKMFDEASAVHGRQGKSSYERICKVGDTFFKLTGEFEYNRYDKQYYYVDCEENVTAEEIALTPEQKGAVQCLFEIFGGTTTATGHKLLDSHVSVIYGDSITLSTAQDIFERLDAKGFASGNVVLGLGSFSYQYVSRDTFGMAIKSTYAEVNGEERFLLKDPKTGDGVKKSATGLLAVLREQNGAGDYYLVDGLHKDSPELGFSENCLKEVFRDGKLLVEQSLTEIRGRLHGDKF